MIWTHVNNDQVIGYLASKGTYAKSKDIMNRSYTMFNNDPDHAMPTLIEEKGYEVRYVAKQGEKQFLRSIFFAHKDAINRARAFPESILMDATYKTNQHGLPLINVIGTGNIDTLMKPSFVDEGSETRLIADISS